MSLQNHKTYDDLLEQLAGAKSLEDCQKTGFLFLNKIEADYAEIAKTLDPEDREDAHMYKDAQSLRFVAAHAALTEVPKVLVQYECAVFFQNAARQRRCLHRISDALAPLVKIQLRK